jgi:hypothetical protein
VLPNDCASRNFIFQVLYWTKEFEGNEFRSNEEFSPKILKGSLNARKEERHKQTRKERERIKRFGWK